MLLPSRPHRPQPPDNMAKPLLFTPLRIKDVTFKNRAVIAPMATYAAVEGIAQDFHFAHWGRLVLGGAGCLFVEATAVTDAGRITNGDLGLWSAAHVLPLKRIAAFMKTRGVVPGFQIAHAGRKGSMQRPWHGNGALTGDDLWGFQVPFAERVRREAAVMSMAVGLIVEPHFAEDILRQERADLIAIGREALVNPCWPQMAEIALGRRPVEAMDDWPVEYGWWLKHREWAIERIRADAAVTASEDLKEMRQ